MNKLSEVHAKRILLSLGVKVTKENVRKVQEELQYFERKHKLLDSHKV